MSVALTPNADAQWRLTIDTTDLDNPAQFGWVCWPGMYADAVTEADLPDVVMADGCGIEWGFTDGQVPAQLEPSSLTFTLWARSAAALPSTLQRGSLLEWELVLEPFIAGVPSPVSNPNSLPIWAVTGGYVTEATLQLVPGSRWPARLTVKAVDLLADLPSLMPQLVDGSTVRRRARERLVQLAGQIGRSIGLPTGTTDGAMPPTPWFGGGTAAPRMSQQQQGNARDLLAAWCNAQDVSPGGIVTPWYDTTLGSYPTGYGSCVPSSWYQAAIANPLSRVKYMVAPGTKPNPTKLPLRLAPVVVPGVVGSQLQLKYAPEAEAHTAAVDGAVVEVPGTLRSGREHAPNLLTFTGYAEAIETPSDPNSKLVERPLAAAIGVGDWGATPGVRGREVPTLLELGAYDNTNQDIGNTVQANLATYAVTFAPDSYATSTAWAFDAILVRADLMPMAQARSVLPQLLPAYPVGTGVGEGITPGLIRHATLYNMDPAVIRPSDLMPQGYVTRGRILLESGAMTLEVTLTPAAAQSSGSRITVGEVDAASWHAIPAGNIDRSIRVADLALVDY